MLIEKPTLPVQIPIRQIDIVDQALVLAIWEGLEAYQRANIGRHLRAGLRSGVSSHPPVRPADGVAISPRRCRMCRTR